MTDQDQHIREIQREYLDFLDDEVSSVLYKKIQETNWYLLITGRPGNLLRSCQGNDQ